MSETKPNPKTTEKAAPAATARKTRKKKIREKSVQREYFELIVETAVFVFFVMTFVVQAFQIPTGSMEPTLLIGDFLLVNKFAYARPKSGLEDFLIPNRALKRHNIVVFKYPQELAKDFVKRVVGLEGEKVEIKDKQVFVNDQPIQEPFKFHSDNQVFKKSEYYQYDDPIRDNYGPVTVPPGQLFVMGDNRDNSMDSRYWGFLPLSHVKGRPWMIYFSYQAERNAYLQTSFRDRLTKIATFLPKARWRRMLKIIR